MAIDDIIKKIVPQTVPDFGYVRPGNNPKAVVSTRALRNLIDYGTKSEPKTAMAKMPATSKKPGVTIEPINFTKANADKVNWTDKIRQAGESMVPYLSNVANELVSPTGPRQPAMVTASRLPKPNFDATRNEIAASESAIAAGADQSLGGNAATAVKLGARAQTLGAFNKVAEMEDNALARTAATQGQMDLQAGYINAMNRNAFQTDLQEAGNMKKSQRLANLSNFADKVVASKNVDNAMDLDKQKFAFLQQMYNKKLNERQLAQVQEIGKSLGITFGKRGGRLIKYIV